MRVSEFGEWIENQRTWSEATFGRGDRAAAILSHIECEVKEVRQCPSDLEEWVDIILLSIDGARRQGYTGVEIVSAILEKQGINKRRSWPIPPVHDDGKPLFHRRRAARWISPAVAMAIGAILVGLCLLLLVG